jgi:hypothetical protein
MVEVECARDDRRCDFHRELVCAVREDCYQSVPVNLTAIRRNTQFTDEYEHLWEGMTGEEYSYAVSVDGSWECAEDSMGYSSTEATYFGWCGYHSEDEVQPEAVERR